MSYLLPNGIHRLVLKSVDIKTSLSEKEIITFYVKTVTGLNAEVPFFIPQEMLVEDDHGVEHWVTSIAGQYALARVKDLGRAAANGFQSEEVTALGKWSELDESEKTQLVLEDLQEGRRHVVDVEVTELMTKTNKPVKVYSWFPVSHKYVNGELVVEGK